MSYSVDARSGRRVAAVEAAFSKKPAGIISNPITYHPRHRILTRPDMAADGLAHGHKGASRLLTGLTDRLSMNIPYCLKATCTQTDIQNRVRSAVRVSAFSAPSILARWFFYPATLTDSLVYSSRIVLQAVP